MSFNLESLRTFDSEGRRRMTISPNNSEQKSFNTENRRFSNLSTNGTGFINKNAKQNSELEENSYNKNRLFEELNPMSLDTVKDLLLHSSEDILLTILNEENGFTLLLQGNTERDLMAHVLLVIGKALSSCMQRYVRALILKINTSKKFLSSIHKYLATFHSNSSQQYHFDSLISLTKLLSKLQMQFSSSSSDFLLMLLPQLRKTCDEFLVHSDSYTANKNTLDDIILQNEIFLQNFTPTQTKTSSENEKMQLQEPPENYRSIPILPNAANLQDFVFLRPNIISGCYQDTEHYLDVQFRLLREDYLKPLRDGIAEFKELKKAGKPLKNCKNVTVYEDVRIISQQLVRAGLIHIALFSDANFADIKWEYSKRFLTGSLLCLTDNDFETILFATVAERNVNKLQEGKLILRFEELTDEILNLHPQRSFIVLETTAYFEAYRYNLKALSELNEAKLPLQNYIVKMKKDVSVPMYLNENTIYDFRPLLLPLEKKYIEETSSQPASYDFPPEVEADLSVQSVSVLKDSSWPSHTTLNLDASQFAALKSAVTKEFAIIQGPPGTGKTYIGLRIVQLILYNINKNALSVEKTPILIVCYTNHALDQFLEGVSLFTQKIVRIGGRCQTEALEKFQLSNLKQSYNYHWSIPESISENLREKQSQLYELRKDIDSKREFLENSNRTVFRFADLRDCIPIGHLISLNRRRTSLKNDVLYEWLSLSENAVHNLDYEYFGNRNDLPDSDEENDEKCFDNFQVYSIEFSNIPLSSSKNRIAIAKSKVLLDGATCKQTIYDLILNILKYCTPLLDRDAERIRNVAVIDDFTRWMLYKYWVSIFIRKHREECDSLQNELSIKQEQMERRVSNRLSFRYEDNVARLKKEISHKNNLLKNCLKTVLSEDMVENFISPQQLVSLRKFGRNCQEKNQAIFNWLKLKPRNKNSLEDRCYVVEKLQEVADHFKKEFELTFSDSMRYHRNKFDITDADDIDYIEAQRYNVSDEFGDVSFNFSTQHNRTTKTESIDSEWKTPGGKRKLKKYIKRNLYNKEKMSEAEAMAVKHVWSLPIDKKWQLYKFWLDLFHEKKQSEILEMQRKFRELYEELNELKSLEDAYLCKEADIIGITTTGAAKYKHIIEILNPMIVIVEEAAELLESHVVTSLAQNTQHVILIGDHQQLRPSPTVHLLSVKYHLNVSLFERMVKNGMECLQLKMQHRMRPDVARLLVPHIYKDLENHESVSAYEDIKGLAKNIFFLSHNNLEFQEGDSKSKVNQYEATFIVKLCKYLLFQNYEPSQITILTTYSGQLFEIKRLAKGTLDGVRITVVDNFQGEENDIVLVSFVRSNDEGEIGFLKVSNRICVALSRAKKGLYCIGNFKALAENSAVWKNITNALAETDSIGDSLELKCQNHINTSSFVANESDFDCVKDGGCNLYCEYRLECGHACPRKCHPYDQEHSEVTCYKSCGKLCPEGHPCQKKCFEGCGQCTVPILTKIEKCGHEINVACYLKDSNFILCTENCVKVLPCGHEINIACHVAMKHIICTETFTKILSCGHEISIECRLKDTFIQCSTNCERTLQCGHKINVPCYVGDEEINCDEICIKKLPCGHEISIECYSDVKKIDCLKMCEKLLPCGHDCSNLCCEECTDKCDKLCIIHSSICDHYVTDKCSWRNDAEYLLSKCAVTCNERLSCLHTCKGTCSSCHQGRLHTECNQNCRRILICGHECESVCSKSCPPCKKLCENWCDHARCLKKCSESCDICIEPCQWVCDHKKCSRLCGELCDRTACEEDCPKMLECGHACLGFCGEPCPKLCKICDPFNEAFIKTGSNTNEKFILLEDCNHTFPSSYFNPPVIEETIIQHTQMKRCPTCKTLIRKNFHLGSSVKICIRNVANIKFNIKLQEEKVKNLCLDVKSRAVKHLENATFKFSRVFYKQLLECVDEVSKNRTAQEILRMKHFMEMLSKFENSIGLNYKMFSRTTYGSIGNKLKFYLINAMFWISTIFLDDYLTASEEKMYELKWELFRVQLGLEFLAFFVDQVRGKLLIPENKIENWNNLKSQIMTYKTFREPELSLCAAEWNVLTDGARSINPVKHFYTHIINHSTFRWRKCIAGHLYFAEHDEENVCTECEEG